MDESRATGGAENRWLRARLPIAIFFSATLFHLLTVYRGISVAGIELASLGVYFDGHLYIEIAKSFPLPYAAEGRDYLGHAPGYPALIFVLEKVLPGNWGSAAIAASVLPAAAAAVAFHALAHRFGIRALWPTVAFVVANARWISMSSTAHAESLAMLLVVLCFLDHRDGNRFRAVAWLTLAGLTRFPAFLLGAPLALGLLVCQKDRRLSSFAALSLPLLAFGLFNLYLYWHIPNFKGISAAHAVFWKTHLSWPLNAWLMYDMRSPLSPGHIFFSARYAFLAFYAVTAMLGLMATRFRGEGRFILWLWVLLPVLFSLSLSGKLALGVFTRLAILAWPAALLILALVVEPRIHRWVARAVVLALAVYGLTVNEGLINAAVFRQNKGQPFLSTQIERLDEAEPHWVQFRQMREKRSRDRGG